MKWLLVVLAACLALGSAFGSEAEQRQRRLCPPWMKGELCCYDRCPNVCDTCQMNKCQERCLKRYDRKTWEWYDRTRGM
jgi:hypothetical protein